MSLPTVETIGSQLSKVSLEAVDSKTIVLPSNTSSEVVKTGAVDNKTVDAATKIVAAVTETNETAPKATETATKTVETATKTVETATKTVETATRTVDTVTKTVDTVTKTVNTVPKIVDTATKTVNNTVKTIDTVKISEISVFHPSGKPRICMVGSAPHSVIYILYKSFWPCRNLLLKALREEFPRDVGIGLIIKEYPTRETYELVLSTEEDCDDAIKNPIRLEYNNRSYQLTPHFAVAHSRELYKVHLSNMSIFPFDTLRDAILETFSKFGRILDIVLYEDDPTGSWFTGNGYIYIARNFRHFRYQYPTELSLSGLYNFSTVKVVWSKVDK